jgi:hypothetical protein
MAQARLHFASVSLPIAFHQRLVVAGSDSYGAENSSPTAATHWPNRHGRKVSCKQYLRRAGRLLPGGPVIPVSEDLAANTINCDAGTLSHAVLATVISEDARPLETTGRALGKEPSGRFLLMRKTHRKMSCRARLRVGVRATCINFQQRRSVANGGKQIPCEETTPWAQLMHDLR